MANRPENLKLREKSYTFSDVTHASQRSYKFSTMPLVKHLNLELFKLLPCSLPKYHNHKQCMNYHSCKDRKRYGDNYSRQLCQYADNPDNCPDGDDCLNAHSRVYQLYRYDCYKKCFCSHYPNSIEYCPYGDFCSFAHSYDYILVNLIHNYAEDDDFYMFYYKTYFCPFNLTEHDKSQCVYAHNWQDYRRNPFAYYYEPITCFNWKLKDYITEYGNGCQNGSACTMCHGWKYQQYHPLYYCTFKCYESGCKKGSCPFYHSEKERRVIEQTVMIKQFKFVPKNRIVEGVFKSTAKKVGFKLKEEYRAKTEVNRREGRKEFKTWTQVGLREEQAKNKLNEGDMQISGKEIIDSEYYSDEHDDIVQSQMGKLNLDY